MKPIIGTAFYVYIDLLDHIKDLPKTIREILRRQYAEDALLFAEYYNHDGDGYDGD